MLLPGPHPHVIRVGRVTSNPEPVAEPGLCIKEAVATESVDTAVKENTVALAS